MVGVVSVVVVEVGIEVVGGVVFGVGSTDTLVVGFFVKLKNSYIIQILPT